MEDRYLYRKVLSSAIVMALFATVVWIAGGMLGYYWSGLQGHIADLSISWQKPSDGMQGFIGSTIFFVAIYVPVIVIAVIASLGKRGRRAKWPFQVLLIIPLVTYLASSYFEITKLLPLGRELLDIDVALDNAVYVPFAAIGLIVALYMLLVIVLPSFIGTRIIGILTVLISGICYIVYAGFIIYNYMMTMLGGMFTTVQFAIYLICFACDAVAFYFMLSVLMTFCTIRREDRMPIEKVPVTRKIRKQMEALEAKAALEAAQAERAAQIAQSGSTTWTAPAERTSQTTQTQQFAQARGPVQETGSSGAAPAPFKR